MIHILAPVRNYETAKMQIDAGADEIYLGVDGGDFNVYSYGGRFKSMNNVVTQVSDVDELAKISRYCRKKGRLLQLTMNMHYIPREFEEGYMEHLRNCAPYIDQVIISNVGLISKVRKAGIDIPVAAGSFTFIPNSEMIKYLQSLGVVRVVLPHASRVSEIAKIHDAVPDMELEIFALIGGGNNCGRCMMFHSPLKCDIGPGCRATYDVTYDGRLYERVPYMDAAADCSLCSMKELTDAGAYSLKIVGREMRNEVVASQFTEIFYEYRKCMMEGMGVGEIKQYLSENVFGWDLVWKDKFCNNQRCKFRDTDITRSYVI